MKAWNVVANDLTAKIDSAKDQYSGYTLVLTGHSFGGALAALGGTALRNAGYDLDIVSLILLSTMNAWVFVHSCLHSGSIPMANLVSAMKLWQNI